VLADFTLLAAKYYHDLLVIPCTDPRQMENRVSFFLSLALSFRIDRVS